MYRFAAEERRMGKILPEYEAYRRSTPALLPRRPRH
jgi:protein-S-isoprenylcysteine O-methyltransferase Ste14